MPLNNSKRKSNSDHQAGLTRDQTHLARETRTETNSTILNSSDPKPLGDDDQRTLVSSATFKDTAIENVRNILACSHHKMDTVNNAAEHITVNADPAEQELKPLDPELKYKLQHLMQHQFNSSQPDKLPLLFGPLFPLTSMGIRTQVTSRTIIGPRPVIITNKTDDIITAQDKTTNKTIKTTARDSTTTMIGKDDRHLDLMTRENSRTTRAIFETNLEMTTVSATTTTETTVDKAKMDSVASGLGASPVIETMTAAANLAIGIIETMIDATITATAIMATILTSLLSDNDQDTKTDNMTETMDITTQDPRANMINDKTIPTKDERHPSSNHLTTANNNNKMHLSHPRTSRNQQ
jgi:hypothetical protein